MIGTISLATSLFFALLAAMAYGYAMKVEEEQDRARRWGRWSLLGACLAAVVASIYLWAMILGDHFEIAYVASYSSRELPLMYKISAFWAGQQGSLLLWLLIHALASLYLCGRERMTATQSSTALRSTPNFCATLSQSSERKPRLSTQPTR